MKESAKRIKYPKSVGVYYRDSSTRRHLGKPDRCYDISYRDQNGKLKCEKVGWTSEGYNPKMAVHVRNERLRNIRHGDELPNKKKREITLGEVWIKYDKWLDTGKKWGVTDRGYYKNHLKKSFENKYLSEITPLVLEELKSDLIKKDLAPATVKHILVIIRQLINKAITWELWSGENPVSKIKLPRINNRRERFLSKTEAKTLLDTLKETSLQLHDMALLSLHTGMRAGEIFDLTWQHINFENNIINIADPKGGPARKVFMTPTGKEMLNKIEHNSPSEHVFKSREGERINEISNAFGRAVEKLGFNVGIDDRRQRVTFHTLRHTFASWLAMRGEHILTIKELLGHKSLAMTERYAHLMPDQKRRAINGIETFFMSAENI